MQSGRDIACAPETAASPVVRGESHFAVKIVVQSPEKEVMFTKLIRRLGPDVDLEAFVDRNWWREEYE